MRPKGRLVGVLVSHGLVNVGVMIGFIAPGCGTTGTDSSLEIPCPFWGVTCVFSLPPFMEVSLTCHAGSAIPQPNPDGPAFGRKVAVYAGCHDEFNVSTPGLALMKVVAHNGFKVRIEHPDWCGMPKFENGDLPAVGLAATRKSAHFGPLIDEGWNVVALTTSCSLMLKFEWPLISPDNAALAFL